MSNGNLHNPRGHREHMEGDKPPKRVAPRLKASVKNVGIKPKKKPKKTK